MTKPIRILLVDDEILLTKLFKLSLEKTGRFSVHTENSPLCTFRALETFPADIIFLDILMPEMKGTTLAARLKDDPKWSHIPVVFLSGCEESAAPGYRFLSKPASLAEIIQCIEEALSLTPTLSESATAAS